MDMVDVEFGQTPLLIVHMKTFTPRPIAVIFVIGDVGAEIKAEPETSVHVPDPIAGVFPAITVAVAQTL